MKNYLKNCCKKIERKRIKNMIKIYKKQKKYLISEFKKITK